jgi:hypothetical protein
MPKDNSQIAVPLSLDQAMAENWENLSKHYQNARERQGLLWNQTNSLDILNCFIDQDIKLIDLFGDDYYQLGKGMVEESAKRFKTGLSLSSFSEQEILNSSSAMQKNAACWREMMACYSRIHGRLRVELRAWNQGDYAEFESAINRMSQLNPPVVRKP